MAVAGYGDADERRRSAAAGFDAHQVKPLAADALERLLTPLLARNPRQLG